jgi:hypothetical protein
MIDTWTDHFKKAAKRPVRLDGFDEAATEILVWWREFLIDTKKISFQRTQFLALEINKDPLGLMTSWI